MERHFPLVVNFMFTVILWNTHMSVLFITPLSTVLHHQALIWCIILLVLSILPKKKDLRRKEDITGMLDGNITEGSLIEVVASIEPFGYSVAVLSSTIRHNPVKKLAVTDL